MNREPLITAAIVTSIIGALITLLKAFGVPLTADQQAAISSFVVLVAPLLMAFFARSKVTPLADPRDEDNHPLTRAGTDAPTLKQTRSALKM